MSKQASIKKNGKMAVGSPVSPGSPKHVRRAHLVKDGSNQLFIRTTRATYKDLPPALKAQILELTDAKVASLKKELGADFGVAAMPEHAPSAGASSASTATPRNQRKRQHDKFVPSRNTPEGLTPSRRDGTSSSFAITLGDSPMPGPSNHA